MSVVLFIEERVAGRGEGDTEGIIFEGRPFRCRIGIGEGSRDGSALFGMIEVACADA